MDDSSALSDPVQNGYREEKIIEGLAYFNPNIVEIYKGALLISKSDSFPGKSFYLAHAAREISSGIRNSLASVDRSPNENSGGIVKAILAALNVPEETVFAKKWKEVTRDLSMYAHWGKSRTDEDVQAIWDKHDEVLYELVGNYHSLLQRVDRILEYRVLPKKVLKVIPALVNRDSTIAKHFYQNASVKWFVTLSEIKLFEPSNSLDPIEQEDGFYQIPLWPPLDYLLRVSAAIQEGTSNSEASELIVLINSISQLKTDNRHTWRYFTKILSNLDNDQVTEDVLENLSIWLSSKFDTLTQSSAICESLLPKFLKEEPTSSDIQKAELIFTQLITVVPIERSESHQVDKLLTKTDKYKPVVYLHPFVNAMIKEGFAKRIGELCSDEVLFKLEESVLQLSGSYSWEVDETPLDKFEDEADAKSPRYVFMLVYRNIIREKAKIRVAVIEELWNRQSDHHFKRICFYLIAENWTDAKHYFWDWLKKDTSIFSQRLLQGELRYLLNKNVREFGKQEKETLKQLFDAGKFNLNEESIGTDYDLEWRLIWYGTVKNDDFFKPDYDDLVIKLNGLTIDKYDQDQKVTVRSGSVPPISADELLNKSVDEIFTYLVEFKQIEWLGPSTDGLANVLQSAVESNPSKFSNELHKLDGLPYLYVYHILYGFEKAWKSNRSFDWESTIDFANRYVKSSDFGGDNLILKDDSWSASSDWVLGSIGQLISEGTRDDDHALAESFTDKALELMCFISGLLSKETPKNDRQFGYVNYSLNSTAGKVLRGLFDVALRKARLTFGSSSKEAVKWDRTTMEAYEGAINMGIADAYILEGMYLSQFMYLDEAWIKGQVQKNLGLDDEWKYFMGGYVGTRIIGSDKVFQLMKPHYQKALDLELFFKGPVENGVHRHLLNFYFWGFEKLETGTLIWQLLEKASPEILKSLIQSVWGNHSTINEKDSKGEPHPIKKKVFEFWERLLCLVTDEGCKENREVLASLGRWIVFIDKLGKNEYSMISKSVPFVDKGFMAEDIIKELYRLQEDDSPETANHIGLLLKKLQVPSYPDGIKEKFTDLVKYVYGNEPKQQFIELGDSICDKYGRHWGYEFLRDVYKENHPSQ